MSSKSPTSTTKFTSFETTTDECCQNPGTYELTCKDKYGDGWHGGYVEIQGKKYCEKFSNGKIKKKQVTITGSCTLLY